jgi:uncharacterized protein DUF3179
MARVSKNFATLESANNNTTSSNSGKKGRSTRRWALWLLLALIVVAALVMVAIPVFVIMPFKAQAPAGVEWSYRLRRWSPLATVTATLVFLALCLKLWRGARWWGRSALAVLLLPLLAVAWFAQQNHFEWLFNPLPNAAYARASEAGFVAENDLVMAVEINGEAVAYPVRQMAYHHVINDVVGGKPITATY